MTCTEHDRDHCPDPRCHVLAVCEKEITSSPLHSSKWTLRNWASCYRYPWPTADIDFSRNRLAVAMADRLVAWMRWPGERRAGPLARVCSTILSLGTERQELAWSKHGPGHYHPLDAIAPHPTRVKGLVSECEMCSADEIQVTVDSVARVSGTMTICSHSDGINWATVAVLLDGIQELGIGLDVVHEWRPHDDETERHDDDTLWTDQDFQEMAISYPFSWTDIRDAATVWREWLNREISRSLLTTFCEMAGPAGMRPASFADSAARLELLGRESLPPSHAQDFGDARWFGSFQLYRPKI